jgi:hypothetical protein
MKFFMTMLTTLATIVAFVVLGMVLIGLFI